MGHVGSERAVLLSVLLVRKEHIHPRHKSCILFTRYCPRFVEGDFYVIVELPSAEEGIVSSVGYSLKGSAESKMSVRWAFLRLNSLGKVRFVVTAVECVRNKLAKYHKLGCNFPLSVMFLNSNCGIIVLSRLLYLNLGVNCPPAYRHRSDCSESDPPRTRASEIRRSFNQYLPKNPS